MNDKVHDEISEDDLMAALKETKTYAQISAEDLKKIYSIAFKHAKSRLTSKILVRDVMSENVIAAQKFDDITSAARILSENNISGLPVVDKENHVIGIISEADVLAMMGTQRQHTFKDFIMHLFGHPLPERKMGDLVGDIMTPTPITIRPDADISEAAKIMDEKRIRRLAVVDPENRLVGVISRRDILKAISRK
ncbi:MAG: CBS domain-containing protein [Nitrospiraceae bacterium]|nr:CBS domain-containing protein [Nitrospiraceae bacterium]